MKTFGSGILVVSVMVLCLGVSGCKELDESFDCQQICEEFKRCVDPVIDVDACQDRCFDSVDRDSQLREEADDCAACISNRTCAEVDLDCGTCPDVYMTFRPE